ncbi:TIGR03960 family B12-binding radical SAM protein, partial [Bacteriovoracaceae bacterium]|nr:TIGR03960 family B12-binding radical SAM protein [Bacteriovoracaceae bacterium]
MKSINDIDLESVKNPYAKFLLKIEKPARYTGGEHFIVRKDWNKNRASVALCFPDVYEIGMSFLGFKILYKELNDQEDIVAERVFSPWIDMEEELRNRKLPLVSLETFKPLSTFDIVGITLQYEMTYTNVLNMLNLGGVEVYASDRKELDPIVIAGGPCATHPEPIAPFFDIIVIGDGEGLFVEITRRIKKLRKQSIPRKKILEDLSKLNGVYVPSLVEIEVDELGFETVRLKDSKEKIQRNVIMNLNDYPFPVDSPIPHQTAIFDKFSVELARGCTEGCRFCQAGMIYRPVRERDPKQVEETILTGVKKGGLDGATLSALSTADYSAITPLATSLLDKMGECEATLGIASLRAYGLDVKVMDKLAKRKNGSLTFAPEAGSDRMREVINKNISETDILETADRVFSRGWSKMKLYFMIGLPTEEMEDVIAIAELGRKVRQRAHKLGIRNPQVTISVSTFVPKPHTPFQWAPMERIEDVEMKQQYLFKKAREYKLNFRKHVSSVSQLEAVFSRGDRKVSKVIETAWKNGARFDGWNEVFDDKIWKNSFSSCEINMDSYLNTMRMDLKTSWNHIDVGVSEKYFVDEWKRAVKNKSLKPCGKPVGNKTHFDNLEQFSTYHYEQKKKLACYHCGIACDLDGMVDERKDYLTKLDAIENLPYTPEEFDNSDPLSHRERRGQDIGYKYRIKFTKLGPLSFVSHLDLQKIIARILRRSEVDLLYSEGFHKRPLVAFGPALPLGINSKCEYMDVRIRNKITNFDKMINLFQQF